MISYFIVVFFFFQAEDGIRDVAVTGVQTCALPIFLVKDLKVKGSSTVLKKGSKIKGIRLVDGADGHNVDCKTELGSMLLKSEFLRSEERRVGKECRSRWSPYH